jgi:hypothetical protein
MAPPAARLDWRGSRLRGTLERRQRFHLQHPLTVRLGWYRLDQRFQGTVDVAAGGHAMGLLAERSWSVFGGGGETRFGQQGRSRPAFFASGRFHFSDTLALLTGYPTISVGLSFVL